MKIKETVSGLLKSSMTLLVALFSLQTMAEPPAVNDNSEGQEQVEAKEPVVEGNEEHSKKQEADKD